MKKQFIFALMSGIALSGAVTFSACSSSSEEVIDNPDYNPTTNSVKAQLAISLQDNIAKTRMSDAATQTSGTVANFLGMKNIRLIPFATSNTTIASNTRILSNTIISLNDIPASTSGTETESNKVYTDVSVPVTTDRFLLYGSAGLTAGFENGNLTVAGLGSNTATDVSGVSFKPVSICLDVTTTEKYRTFKNILQLLNRVASTSITYSGSTITWGTGTNQTTHLGLASLFNSYTSVTVGSSEYAKYLLEYLYNAVSTLATTGSSPEKDLALQIQTNIISALSYTDGEAINCIANTFDATNSTLTLSSSYTGYPTDLNLPHGAARIAYSSGIFVDGSIGNIGTLNVPNMGLYVYPANLQYFVESDILTATNQVLNGTMSTFTAAQGLYGASPATAVTANTRSILLNKQIQYGVGRLAASVNALTGIKYFDNVGNEVPIPDAGYTLKGILIGDQREVGWNFAQSGTTSYTIYDKLIAGATTGAAVTKTSASATNQTLVLETSDDGSINIALEFVNNGAAFVGADGIVPAGGTFYLIGTLTPASNDTNYGTGTGKTKKVFAQDFVTTASFTITTGASSTDANTWGGTAAGLGLARVGLPDLRQPQLELGLSVDLHWTPGLTFNVDI